MLSNVQYGEDFKVGEMKFINDGVIPAEKVFYTLQNMVDTFRDRDKIEETIESMFCLENHEGVLIIHHIGTIHKKYIQEIWQLFGEDYENVESIEYKKINRRENMTLLPRVDNE